MLPTREIIAETARLIEQHKLQNLIVDPVIRSTSGFDLIDDGALKVLVEKLFPLSELVTPNLPEAERIARMKIENETDISLTNVFVPPTGNMALVPNVNPVLIVVIEPELVVIPTPAPDVAAIAVNVNVCLPVSWLAERRSCWSSLTSCATRSR